MLGRKFLIAGAAAAAVLVLVAAAGGANRNNEPQSQRLTLARVTIKTDGIERRISTTETTVGAVLKEAGVEVGPHDLVSPSAGECVRDGMKIKVVRVRYELEAVIKPIAFETIKTFSKSIRPGLVKEVRPGETGERIIQVRVRYEDGRAVSRVILRDEIIKQPVNRVVCIGSRGRYTSRGEFRTRRVLTMHATAYDPGPKSCGKYATGRTACGLQAGYGVVAVDPKVIPLGTHLYIEGYGHAIAGDRGRAIKGNRIDLGFSTHKEAIRFGRKRVTVHVLCN